MRRRVAWTSILPVAIVEFLLLFATSNRYGYHRDELYFIEAAKHPAFGYDDQPPLTPLLGRLSAAVVGNDPRGLRAVSAVAMALTVIIVVLIAREFGAGRAGQLVVACCTAASFTLFAGHLLSTSTFDLLFWVTIAWLVARIVGGGDPRQWLLVGAVVGVALENKHLVLMLVLALAVGLVVVRRFDVVRSRWLWAGTAIAVAVWIPNLAWQARHGWPQLDLAHKIADEDPIGNRVKLVVFQFLALPWLGLQVVGLRRLLRSEDAARFRMFGYGYVALVAVGLIVGAKPYYTAGLLLVLLAAGGVPVERWIARRKGHRTIVIAVIVASAAVSIPLALPVVPVADVHATPIPSVNEDAIETIGWPRFVDKVAEVWQGIPDEQRTHAVIFAGNYGEAGAVDRFGPAIGLPRAYSGHNNFARWGVPPRDAAPVIVLGWDRLESLDGYFVGCEESTRIDNGVHIDNEEQGLPVWTCRAPARPWNELWPLLRHLSP